MVRRNLAWLLAAAWLLTAVPAVAATATLQATAVILSNSNCRFTTATPNTLAFGTIDPTTATNVTTTRVWTFRCNGGDLQVSYQITAGNGANFSGGTRRMKSAATTATYLPYDVSVSPSSGTVNRNTPTNFTITGTVTASNAGAAVAGTYTDTVTVTIAP